MSTGLMWALTAVYAVITVAAACERRWSLSLYFLGAVIITVAVLWMAKGNQQ